LRRIVFRTLLKRQVWAPPVLIAGKLKTHAVAGGQIMPGAVHRPH
jgi:hypothetical protein